MVHPGSVCGKITFKLSNFQGWLHMVHPGSVCGKITFKLLNFQGWLHMVHPGPVCGEIPCRRPSFCKVQVSWNLGP